MQFIQTNSAPQAIGPYSQGIKVDNFYFFSGQIALTADGIFLDKSVEIQTKQILENIKNILLSENLKKENVVKSTIFLKNIEDFDVVNKIYAEFFGEHKPARSTVEVSRLPKNAKIEIEILAYKIK